MKDKKTMQKYEMILFLQRIHNFNNQNQASEKLFIHFSQNEYAALVFDRLMQVFPIGRRPFLFSFSTRTDCEQCYIISFTTVWGKQLGIFSFSCGLTLGTKYVHNKQQIQDIQSGASLKSYS